MLVAWPCEHGDVVRLILDRYYDADLLQLTNHAVSDGYVDFFTLVRYYEAAQRNASWLPKGCMVHMDPRNREARIVETKLLVQILATSQGSCQYWSTANP